MSSEQLLITGLVAINVFVWTMAIRALVIKVRNHWG